MSQRICPGCGEVKECDLAHGGGQWYTRTRKHREIAGEVVIDDAIEVIASPYCRDCTGKRNTESRRKTTLINKLVKVSRSAGPQEVLATGWPGTCEICGDQTQNVVVVESPRLEFCCWRCAGLLKERRASLVAMLRVLLTHIVRERELVEKAMDSGRWPESPQRPVHKGNKLGKIEDHEECLGLEMRVRSVLLWLLSSEAREAEGV